MMDLDETSLVNGAYLPVEILPRKIQPLAH